MATAGESRDPPRSPVSVREVAIPSNVTLLMARRLDSGSDEEGGEQPAGARAGASTRREPEVWAGEGEGGEQASLTSLFGQVLRRPLWNVGGRGEGGGVGRGPRLSLTVVQGVRATHLPSRPPSPSSSFIPVFSHSPPGVTGREEAEPARGRRKKQGRREGSEEGGGTRRKGREGRGGRGGNGDGALGGGGG